MAATTPTAAPEEIVERPFYDGVIARGDFQIIREMVADGARVLDLGCGEGHLMAWLEETKGCEARGVELSPTKVRKAVARGLSVYQGDVDRGLKDYPDKAFDYVILSQTLQETREPREVLLEMIRVGKRAIVAFPNFGHWSARLWLLFMGRAPKTKHLPHEWYDTPNINFVTIPDFEELLKKEGIEVEDSRFLRRDRTISTRPTLLADSAVYLLRKG